MRSAFPTELFEGVHWQRLLARAAEVPAAAMENVFGFEIRLDRPEPATDFCIVVPAGGPVRAHYTGPCPSDEPSGGGPACSARQDARSGTGRCRLASRSLAACLREISRVGSFANTAVAGGAAILEFDVAEPALESGPPPAVFWSLVDPLQSSQVDELARLLAMASGLPVRYPPCDVPGAVAAPEPGWVPALRGVVDVATPYGRILQVGTFVGREQAGVRVLVGRVEPADIAALLQATGWPGPVNVAMDAVAAYALPGMLLAVALDVYHDGVGPRAGIEFAMPGGWAGTRWRHWRPLLDILLAKGLCRAEKALGLKRWCGLTRLYGPRMHFLAGGINHVKIGIREDAVEAKAYLGACRRRAADMDFRQPAAVVSHGRQRAGTPISQSTGDA